MLLDKRTVSKSFWALPAEESLETLQSSHGGITKSEAEGRLEAFGANTIESKRRLPWLKVALNQAKSPLILILVGAGIVTFFIKEYIETVVIFAAVFINGGLGFWQENKAETVFELLKTYIRTRSRVRREGREFELDASELVPGDVIRVSQGDRIPADARILFANNFEVDESVLTGESLSVKKTVDPVAEDASLADRTPMIWSGTLAVAGFADAIVTATGAYTEFGKIASSIASAKESPTPLRLAVSRLAATSAIILVVLTAAIFLVGFSLGFDLFEMFLIAVSIAVSAVPEGLPIALTVILALGAQRIAKKKGVIRKLLAAETLGSTSIILTDKTGTLTQAKMELERIISFPDDKPESVSRILEYALLNTDVAIENPEDTPEKWKLFGRPLEATLVRAAAHRGVFYNTVLKDHALLDKLPFSSEHKFSITLSHSKNKTLLILFGAPEILLGKTGLSQADQVRIASEIDSIARNGKRILGVISKEVGNERKNLPALQELKNFKLDGLLVFHDPLRPDIKETIARVSGAGVRTVIVTGDHQGTAEGIAREIGLIDGSGAVLTGPDIAALSDEDLVSRKNDITVYARVTPEQKVRIVNAYKSNGDIVAMIGDGVNDAPALQAADIGVAVGSGTDVAKSAADLVLLDDRFGTLVLAIEEGRRILGNIRKVIVYLLSNVSNELLLIGGSLLAGIALPITALQILFVNFFSDSFPAIALAFEDGIDSAGTRPRRLHRNLLDGEMKFIILAIGTLTSVLLFVLYLGLLKLGYPEPIVKTFIFASFSVYTLFLAFSLRSLDKSIFRYNPLSNIYLVFGVGVGILLTALVIYTPFLQNIFDTVSLPFAWVMGVLGMCAVGILGAELGKWLYGDRQVNVIPSNG